jgi:UDP-N-acetyl-D-mannosaminuronic acid dehydrogenase
MGGMRTWNEVAIVDKLCDSKKICIIGLGYIGLPTAALLATKGYEVLGVDVKPEVVDTINQGNIHIVEPDLDVFVKSAVQSKRLRASLEADAADIFVLAVPTPFQEGFKPDISYVLAGCEAIIEHLEPGNVVILESTSPVGTTEKIAELIYSKRNDLKEQIHIGHCPERVLPGHIIHELVQNDRIVGGITKEDTSIIAGFYSQFVKGQVLETDARTAEMAKLTENTYRDVNIAFANELSIICDNNGIDVWELIRLANRHPRVNILQPGCGVGGHCIAVDPWFVVDSDPENSKVIKSSRLRNEEKAQWVIRKIYDATKDFQNTHGKPPKIACMGLAFKPNIDDLRESPALAITKQLISDKKYTILPVEPHISSHPDFTIFDSLNAFQQADILVFLVKHDIFKSLKLEEKTVLDFCGVTQV